MSRITVRAAAPADAAALLAIYEYYVLHTAVSFEYDVPTEAEFRRRIGQTLQKYPYYVAEQDGKILGYAYAGAFVGRAAYDWAAELSVYVDKDARHAGIGRALYDVLEQTLREMGYLNLYACIGLPEQGDEYLTNNSADFHAHRGFTLAGTFRYCGYKFGRWYHMIWMEKQIGVHGNVQRAPIAFPDYRK